MNSSRVKARLQAARPRRPWRPHLCRVLQQEQAQVHPGTQRVVRPCVAGTEMSRSGRRPANPSGMRCQYPIPGSPYFQHRNTISLLNRHGKSIRPASGPLTRQPLAWISCTSDFTLSKSRGATPRSSRCLASSGLPGGSFDCPAAPSISVLISRKVPSSCSTTGRRPEINALASSTVNNRAKPCVALIDFDLPGH